MKALTITLGLLLAASSFTSHAGFRQVSGTLFAVTRISVDAMDNFPGGDNADASYQVGDIGGTDYRAGFAFDLNQLAASGDVFSIDSMTMALDNPTSGGPVSAAQFWSFEASGPLYDDFGDGALYSGIFSAGPGQTPLIVTLNAAAIAAANANLSNPFFAFGATLVPLFGGAGEFLFGGTSNNGSVTALNYVVTVVTPIPAPVLLLLAGMLGLGWFKRRSMKA